MKDILFDIMIPNDSRDQYNGITLSMILEKITANFL